MRKVKKNTGIKKWIAVGVIALMSLYPASASAATGDITIQLQGDVDSSIFYSKTATMVNGQWELDEAYHGCNVDLNGIESAEELEETARDLLFYAKENHINIEESRRENGEHSIWLNNLEEGLYLITSDETNTTAMLPTLIALPNWTGEEMSYDVTVVPKFVERQMAPQTGWDSKESTYLLLGMLSFVVVVCYNVRRNRQ